MHGLFKLKNEAESGQDPKPHDAAVINMKINRELNHIIQNFSWKNLATKDKTHFENQLKLAKATLVYLDTFGQVPKPEAIAKLYSNLDEKIKTYELLNKSDEKFTKFAKEIEKHTNSHPDDAVKALFKKEQEHSFRFLKNMQLLQRKGDIQFLQKVIELLNDPSSNDMLPANKAAIMMGALNHLDNELHAGVFTFGINNFKHMMQSLKEKMFKDLRDGSPEQHQLYQVLAAGSQDALQEFIKDHEKNFKHLPDAQKFLKSPKLEKSILHQQNGHQKKSKLANVHSAPAITPEGHDPKDKPKGPAHAA